jgi:hypothetical protein
MNWVVEEAQSAAEAAGCGEVSVRDEGDAGGDGLGTEEREAAGELLGESDGEGARTGADRTPLIVSLVLLHTPLGHDRGSWMVVYKPSLICIATLAPGCSDCTMRFPVRENGATVVAVLVVVAAKGARRLTL